MNQPSPLLQMQEIQKSFGATAALRGVSLAVHAHEVMALIGENGAGKSTLMKILSGAIAADSGQMWLAGRPFRPRGPHDARQRGVVMIYQELNLASDLSVEDNIMLGQEASRWGLVARGAQRERVRQVLSLLGHPDLRPEVPVQRLSPGAQQLVEIARALSGDARIIVFDEPTSSLGRRDAEHLFHVIETLRSSGIAIIYISHFLEEVGRICSRFTVLRDGQSVGSGELARTSQHQIVAMMVGRTVDELFPQVPHTPGQPILSLDSLSGRRLPKDVSLALRRGEILGIAGLVGAGRTELVRSIFALDPVRQGRVTVGGITPRPTPRARIRAGLAIVSEDRKGEGLAQSRSVADNLTYTRLGPYSTAGILHLSRRRRQVEQWMQRLRIQAVSPEQQVQLLSGGNQQKVALARAMHQDADVLLLDEPTRGIDVGTKAEIYRMIGELAAQGKAVIFVSSYLPELLAICDRIGVMARGRLREIRDRHEWTEQEVMKCAVAEG